MSISVQRILLALVAYSKSTILVKCDTYFSPESDPFLGRLVATRPAIHEEIEAALWNSPRGDVPGRLMRLDQDLRPTFEALPKNDHGRLTSTVARYLLHRHFLRQHAWLVFGLAPDGTAWNASSPDDVLKDHVPERLYKLIRERVRERGLRLHEVAVLAALIENVVHDDAVGRLDYIWKLKGLSNRGPITATAMREAADAYMATYIPGINFEGRSQQEIVNDAIAIYPAFAKTQVFVRELIDQKMKHFDRDLRRRDAEELVAEISERYGKWQESECRELKQALMSIKGPSAGRVDLKSFYQRAIADKRFFFTESAPYLRALGALDESNAERPIVMVPNYINSPSQYIAESHFYAVSCLDECEPIIAYFETMLASPDATVDEIVHLLEVRQENPVVVTVDMRDKLLSIADAHEGRVPLHCRLFAQWLNRVYPAECAYPHVAGSIQPTVPLDFMNRTGLPPVESDGSLKALVDGVEPESAAVDSQMWDPREELLMDSTPDALCELVSDLAPYIPYQWGSIASATTVGLLVFLKFCVLGAAPKAASVSLMAHVDA